MANEEQLALLKSGVSAWNKWRLDNPSAEIDLTGAKLVMAVLSGANLDGADLSGANLFRALLDGASLNQAVLISANLPRVSMSRSSLDGANLTKALMSGANLFQASLRGAQLPEAFLDQADLTEADMTEATLDGALLNEAQLFRTNLTDAKLNGAFLERAVLVNTRLNGAQIRECRIHGISVWDIEGKLAEGSGDLIVTPSGQAAVTVDDLTIAQFIYFVLDNDKIKALVDGISSKGVLILGRFRDQRKAVLDALRIKLREFDLIPMVFDFDKPSRRDITETVQLLANMSRLVVADVTDAKSIPQELSHIIPFLPSVPVRPIILNSEYEYSMFEHWKEFNSVLDVYRYENKDQLIADIEKAIILPVEEWEKGFDERKALRAKAKALEARNHALELELKALRAKKK